MGFYPEEFVQAIIDKFPQKLYEREKNSTHQTWPSLKEKYNDVIW